MRRAGVVVRLVTPAFCGHKHPAILDVTGDDWLRVGGNGKSIFLQPVFERLRITRSNGRGFKDANEFPVENGDGLR